MFVEHKEVGEVTEAPAKTLKLSEAIRKGKPFVGHEEIDFRLCALGCAWAGVRGQKMTDADINYVFGAGGHSFAGSLGVVLGFPPELCVRVSLLHCAGHPALEIADMLEAEGL